MWDEGSHLATELCRGFLVSLGMTIYIMNILILDSWLREYLETKATPEQLKDCLSLCGPSVESIEKSGDDFIYNIEITTNRIDMVSIYGIAREAAAILPRFNIPAKLKTLQINELPKTERVLPMSISDPQKNCNRILGIVMEVDTMKTAPAYMKDRLEKCGVRSLNNLVDITNYVMLELGHPCHVFDYDRIKTHKFILRHAKKNEPIVTLDGKSYLLNEEDVIIDDGTGRVIDLPGIMGTENSVVTSQTKRIIFFIESNNPTLIRRTSMRYGIRTMAASINEKHPDPELAKSAMLRGIELYQQIAGGKIAGSLIDIYPHKTVPKKIIVSVNFINERLGIKLPKEDMIKILQSLFFQVSSNGDNLILIPPTYRQFDIEIPEDIVEEVARIYGYHNLPSRLMTGEIPISDKPKDFHIESQIKTALKYWGYTEIYNYSFISKKLIEKSLLDVKRHLRVSNPLTEEIEFMRISLIPSMLNTIYNNQHFADNVYLFELANVYIPQISALPRELPMLLIAGNKNFLGIKGIIETLFDEFGISGFAIKEEATSYFHPKQTIQYLKNNKIIARVGKINPTLISNFEINQDVYAAELNLKYLLEYANQIKKYHPISLYPPVVEDLTFYTNKNTKIGQIISAIYEVSSLIQKVEFIDSYTNSVTLRITYHDNAKNLNSQDIQPLRKLIIGTLTKKFGIKLKD